MKRIKIITIVFGAISLLTGCNYLDNVPEDDTLSQQKIFQTRTGALQWMKDTYAALSTEVKVRANPAIYGSDEFTGGQQARTYNKLAAFYLQDGLQNALSPYMDIWSMNGQYYYIRWCNTFLQRIGDVYNLKPGEKELWTAQVRALKAFYYFEMMKRYGSFVIVPQNIDVWASLDEMRQPRGTVDDCVEAILELLDDSTIDNLQFFREKDSEMYNFFSKEAAIGLKVRVLLYAASPLYNGGMPQVKSLKNAKGEFIFPQTEDKEKWKRAAEYAETAIALLEGQNFGLVKGTNTEATALLNTMKDLESSVWMAGLNEPTKETLMSVPASHEEVNWLLPELGNSSSDPYFDGTHRGHITTNIKMVNKFYTANGLPIEEDKTWKYGNGYSMAQEKDPAYTKVIPLEQDVLALHLQREPRFYASIAAPGLYWKLGNTEAENFLVDTRQGKLFGLKADRVDPGLYQNITGYFIKKGTRSDCSIKNHWTNVNSKVGGMSVVMRMAEIYLAAAEAWNEYEGPNGAHRENIFKYLNMIRERAGIPTVQVSWTTYGTNPNKFNDQAGLRDIIRRERTNEFMFEGHRFWDVRRWGVALQEGIGEKPMGWRVAGKEWADFYNNFQGPVAVWDKASFNPSRDYLWPIRSEEVIIAGISQNPGW